jgi:hypothetical protein
MAGKDSAFFWCFSGATKNWRWRFFEYQNKKATAMQWLSFFGRSSLSGLLNGDPFQLFWEPTLSWNE